MFSFFKKKDARPKILANVLMTKEAKWNALSALALSKPDTVFVGWFDQSIEELINHFQQNNITAEVIAARQLHGSLHASNVVFIEHYPVRKKEEEAFNFANDRNVIIYTSLDEALFRLVGGDRIVNMMKKMGVADNEVINHSLVNKAIQNAQDKIAEKLIIDNSASSQEEWMQRNIERS